MDNLATNFSSVGDAIPLLANLTYLPPDHSRPSHLGGQNFTHCCLRAVNQSITINQGELAFSNSSFLLGQSIQSLLNSVQNDDFPCGAEWDGDPRGSPVVQVSYKWCSSECGGWEISRFDKLQQWVGPLVQFILPSLAFVSNIPRTRKLAIPDVVFQAHPRNIVGFTTYWIRLLGAMVIMTVDTVVWLAICFAFAGPMLLSGVYEFVLDRKILECLCPPEKSIDRPKIPIKLRAHLLLAVVVGNLRISTRGIQHHQSSKQTRQDSYGLYSGNGKVPSDPIEPYAVDDTWYRVTAMLDELDQTKTTVQSDTRKVRVSTKLKAILMSQARSAIWFVGTHVCGSTDDYLSFGSTVGAPILFFVGGFIYTVLDIEGSLGDNDQAHAIAFGMCTPLLFLRFEFNQLTRLRVDDNPLHGHRLLCHASFE